MKALIELVRTYDVDVTQGRIYFNDVEICQSIELPWLHNVQGMSCIPEGEYRLLHRHTEKFGHHLIVDHVPDRKGILLHPANHAQKELRGCIAPVMEIRGHYGMHSRMALNVLLRNIRMVGIHFCSLKISSL
jgi:hypothetical protein